MSRATLCCMALLAASAGAAQDTFRILLTAPTNKPAITRLGDVSNAYYTVPCKFGNQQFSLLLDTGSSTIWVTSALCHSTACAGHPKYDRNLSPTYRGTYNVPFRLQYADNSMETAVYSVDAVSVAGLTVDQQYFGEAAYSGQGDEVDGIFGMGPDAQVVPAGRLKPLTFLTNLQRTGVISNREFSLRLTGGNDSLLTIGGTDPSLYTGSITYAPVIRGYNSWTIKADSVNYGDNNVCHNCPVIVDSGTSAILIPSSYRRVLQLIPGIRQAYGEQYFVPCSQVDRLPNLSFVISGKTFTLTGRDYVEVERGVYFCRLLFVVKNLDEWILGDPFFRKYYIVFNADDNRVGIASSSYRS